MDFGLQEGSDFKIELNVGAKGKTLDEKPREKVGQEQIHGLLFGEQLSWQSIIYDLINTEQLDPWDIDLVILTNRYLQKIKELEEANLFISSKVLFAASLLLRIKSEILLNHYLPSLDEILFGKKEEKKYIQERIELEEEIPGLIPRTPLPRFRKVTLQELMTALGKAVKTENRRIGKVALIKQQELETAIALPKGQINLKERIKEIYTKIKEIFLTREERLAFTELSGINDEEKISAFIPLLHLDYQHKVFLEQEKHFEEIWIWLKQIYEKKNFSELEKMREEAEIAMTKDILEMQQEKNDLSEREEEKREKKRAKEERKKAKIAASLGEEKIEIVAEKDEREELNGLQNVEEKGWEEISDEEVKKKGFGGEQSFKVERDEE